MFEFLIISVAFVLVAWMQPGVWSLVVVGIALLLVAPGVYSMITGAPFVPSTKDKVGGFLKLGNFKKSDKVIEPGCGDGRIIRKVAAKGVESAIGIEFSLPTFVFAWLIGKLSGSKARIVYGNMWDQDYSNADVVICFLLVGSMQRFEKEIWPKLKKGTRVMSNAFKLQTVKPDDSEGGIYLYVKK
jgi:hypothetical protein